MKKLKAKKIEKIRRKIDVIKVRRNELLKEQMRLELKLFNPYACYRKMERV